MLDKKAMIRQAMNVVLPDDAPKDGWTIGERWVLTHPPYYGDWVMYANHPSGWAVSQVMPGSPFVITSPQPAKP